MYYHFILIPVAIVLIIMYGLARKEQNLDRVKIVQPVGCLVAILIAAGGFVAPEPNTGFIIWIIAGMILCFVGDINNINMDDDATVIRGLIIFVFGYLAYGISLAIYNGFHKADIITGIVLLAVYFGFLAYIWKGLGSFKIPVTIYAMIMPFMVWRALSTFFGDTFSTTQAALFSLGTLVLFLGDLEFGVYRFRKPIPMHFGPYFYLGGQLLIAIGLSCRAFP
jgi:uncharacterized membrane protein YhhN